MGETNQQEKSMQKIEYSETFPVETMEGRIQVRWDEHSSATPFGQIAFFIEFLMLSGLYTKWVESCPLNYTGPNGSNTKDILGTWFLSIMSGHRRYAHITSIRSDRVIPELLGMDKVVSEDSVRRGLAAIVENSGNNWLESHLDASVWPLLSTPWILDVDVTIKPLYGKQEGAVIGYNPKKPGRPSHTYHTYQMAGLRLILGMNVEPGNQGHSNTTLPGLLKLIDKLPKDKKPQCVRGDAGFGNEPVMLGLEDRGIPYLLKLRLTKNVKQYIQQILWGADWSDAGQGWEGRDGMLKLQGWDKSRRIIILRRQMKGDLLLKDNVKQIPLFIEFEEPGIKYEFVVLVTDLPHGILSLAQLYRERADSENSFDELKNQWGWGGYVTRDIKRSRYTAMMVAIVYNWWSIFARLANPKMRMEAITSRPFLLSGIGRKTNHAGQKYLTIISSHAKAPEARAILEYVSKKLHEWKLNAEQLKTKSVFQYVCQYISEKVTGLDWMVMLQKCRLPAPSPG